MSADCPKLVREEKSGRTRTKNPVQVQEEEVDFNLLLHREVVVEAEAPTSILLLKAFLVKATLLALLLGLYHILVQEVVVLEP